MTSIAQIQMHPDGRHSVLDAQGNMLGLHNSLASAQRQVADYFTPPQTPGSPAPQGGGIQPMPDFREHQPPMPPMGLTPPQVGSPQPPGGNPGGLSQAPGAMASVLQGNFHQAQATPVTGPPTHADLVAGMNYGAAMTQAHPHANLAQLLQMAQGQQRQNIQGKMQAQARRG